MPHDRHKKRKRREHDRDHDSLAELLIQAGLGDHRRCKRLLKKGASPNGRGFDGTNPLLQAATHGHVKVVKTLLRYGANAMARDARGNTPVHLAARGGHLEAVAALLAADPPPDIFTANLAGVTITAAINAAMAAQDRATDASPERSGGKADDGASRGWEGGDAWSDRLAAELSGDEDDPFGGPWGVPATPVESVDEFAQRIWREMQERQRARAAATSNEFVSARERQRARQAEAAAAAARQSSRILEDEQARDAAWREAVAQGDAGARRASYEARWQRFVADPPASIGLRDVPWILGGPQDLDAAQLRRVVLYGATDAGAQRRCIRAELVRWHPDKFQSRFGQRLAAAEAVGVLAGVVALSQSLNALAAGVTT
ncbi:hypothetical protein ACKKBF_B11860 [Auxenochlorella protothecoides x Auxenochlorella symbiontica]